MTSILQAPEEATQPASPVRPQTPQNTILIYAGPGVGKSTQIALRASQIWKTSKMRSRVVGIDPGGTANALQALIKAGVVEYWPLDLWTSLSPFVLLDQATKGFWPTDVTQPNSPLAPSVKEWKPCSFCGGDSGATFHAMVKECGSCKKPFAAGTVLKTIREPINGLQEVEMVAFDSLTSAGAMLIDHFRKINPEGGRVIMDLTEEERAAVGKMTEAELKRYQYNLPAEKKIASLGKQHYNDAQTKIRQLAAQNVKQLPVNEVIFTALEIGKVKGGENGEKIDNVYGPMLPGKALSKACIPWFGHVIRIEAVGKKGPTGMPLLKDGHQEVEYFTHTAKHVASDDPMQFWEAKTSTPFGGEMPLRIPGRDIRDYFRLLGEAYEKSKKALLG